MQKQEEIPTVVLTPQICVDKVMCPHCNQKNEPTNFKVIGICSDCKKEINLQLSSIKELGSRSIRTQLWIIMKELTKANKVIILSNYKNEQYAEEIVKLLKPFGMQLKENQAAPSKNKKTGEIMMVNRKVLEKDPRIQYYTEENDE